jgi:hypothetical protein
MRLIALIIALTLVVGIAFPYLPTGPGDDDDTSRFMFVTVNSTCDGNLVSVVDKDGAPIPDVHLSVKKTADATPVAYGNTDALGNFSFVGCGAKVDVKATNPDYMMNVTVVTLIACEECAGCISDDDCLGNQYCNAGECLPVPCDCGIVSAHQCNPYECCSDSDCGQNQQCENHTCVGIPQEPEVGSCSEDGDCPDPEFCYFAAAGASKGRCIPVEGCGSVSNHTLAVYQCGNATGCPSCSLGYTCISNVCVPDDIECPPSAAAGIEITCNTTSGGGPCRQCDYMVTDPTGADKGGRTDENGRIRLPLGIKGSYNVSLVKNGTVIKTVAVTAFPAAGGKEDRSTVQFIEPALLAGLLVLILLLAGAILYFLKRKKAGKKAKGSI